MADQQPSIPDELRKLADLKKDGVLSEEEFAAAKADLLRALSATAPPLPPEAVTCKTCDGSGKCQQCDGRGEVVVGRKKVLGWYADDRVYDTCPTCDGSKGCRSCRGRGTL